MSSGPSLYRRHRPRTFADVVGQEHIVRTLRNAVEQGKVHHAYLFVGSRGTGKTSMAKILAACLNCENGPTVEPCGVCDSCRAIAGATSLDVIELDAASHNSVDDIRDLRETVAYAPVSGRHKVYILDEAHMLSTQAWNAFLKTLEEPPPDTIFVLATTEANKVLPTVADRCHRFDFARPGAPEIATVLRRTAESEGIELPEPACALIARAATGSFRDALGTLEQLVTYGGPAVDVDSVLAVLGVADAELLFATVDGVHAADVPAVLATVQRLTDSGRDSGQFFADLERHCRELLITGTLDAVPAELSITPEHDQRLLEQAHSVGRGAVVRLLDLLAAGLEAKGNGADARTQLELALIKAASPELDPKVQALLARIERLEARQSGAPAPAPAAAPPPARTSPPAAPAEPPSTQPAAPEPQGVAMAGPPAAVAEAALTPEPETTPAADPEPAGLVDLEAVRAIWPAVIETIQGANAMLAALIADARPAALDRDELTLFFSESAAFLKRKAEDTANRDTVTSAIQTVTGSRLRLRYELSDDPAPAQDAAGSATLSDEELVARLVAEFDAEEIPDDEEHPA